MKVLIDTSAWIEFLKKSSGVIGDLVSNLIQIDCAYMMGVVQAELMHGAKTKKEKSQLNFLFENIPCLDVLPEDWLISGEKLNELRAKGITVPLTDVLISVIADRNTYQVLTLDKHFQHLTAKLVRI